MRDRAGSLSLALVHSVVQLWASRAESRRRRDHQLVAQPALGNGKLLSMTRRWPLSVCLPRAHASLVAALAITALLGAPRTLPAQLLRVDHIKPNAIYFELGGAGGTYSINYDYRPRERVVLRVGATSWDFTNLDNRREKLSAVIVGAGGLAPWPIGRYRRGDWIEWGALLMGGSQFRSIASAVIAVSNAPDAPSAWP